MNSFLAENLGGMATVQLFNREARNEEKFDGINLASLRILLQQIRINAVFLPLTDLLSALTVGALLWYGGLRHFQSSLSLGVVVASVMYVQRLYEPLRDLTDKFSIFQSAMASSERIFALLDRQEEVLDPRTPKPWAQSKAPWNSGTSGSPTRPAAGCSRASMSTSSRGQPSGRGGPHRLGQDQPHQRALPLLPAAKGPGPPGWPILG